MELNVMVAIAQTLVLFHGYQLLAIRLPFASVQAPPAERW